MNRSLLALAALALAALPASAVAQDSCSAGTVAFITKNTRERTELDSAVAVSGLGSEIQRVIEPTELAEKPELRNASAVSRTMQRNFPSNTNALPDAASVMLLMRIDERGVVTHASASRDVPDQGFNAAAVAVARSMRFRPAKYEGCEIPAWILLPISFSAHR